MPLAGVSGENGTSMRLLDYTSVGSSHRASGSREKSQAPSRLVQFWRNSMGRGYPFFTSGIKKQRSKSTAKNGNAAVETAALNLLQSAGVTDTALVGPLQSDIFASFWIAVFESACQINSLRQRVYMITGVQHDVQGRQDYRLLPDARL